MLSDKAFDGLLKASPKKRYKSFLNTVADLEEVWLLADKDGYLVLNIEDCNYIPVWPTKEFCCCIADENEQAVAIEIHEFISKCKEIGTNYSFMVFPTDVNAYIVTTEQLCMDLEEHLVEVE